MEYYGLDEVLEEEEFDYYYSLSDDGDDDKEYYWGEMSYNLTTDRWNTQPEDNFN